ncbi:MAG: hypothetical protein ACK4RS_04815, partial [Thiothrix sp.]
GYLFQDSQTAVRALQTLARDAALRERLGRASRELLEQQFTIQQMADGYRRVYQTYPLTQREQLRGVKT